MRKIIDTAELKDCADLVSVIESTGSPVQEKNGNIWCLCPFHSDRHLGSAMFSERTKHFRCFACGAGEKGDSVDIIKYVQQSMGLDFRDACEFVAESSFEDLSQFESENEAADKKFQRMNKQRMKALRILGDEKRNFEFDPKYTQVPDGEVVNFVTTKEEAEKYEQKGYFSAKQWEEIDGTFVRTGWLIFRRMKMSTAKFAMDNPEIYADLCSWKKKELLNEVEHRKQKVEETVNNRDDYHFLMNFLSEKEKVIARL